MTTNNDVANNDAAGDGHRFTCRIYYEDTDAAGVVYYANYLKFAERARTEMLRNSGQDHQTLRRELGLGFVVRRCSADYRRPARLDDLIVVHTLVKRIGGARLDLHQEISLENEPLVAVDVELVMLDQKWRPARLPSSLIAALRTQT